MLAKCNAKNNDILIFKSSEMPARAWSRNLLAGPGMRGAGGMACGARACRQSLDTELAASVWNYTLELHTWPKSVEAEREQKVLFGI